MKPTTFLRAISLSLYCAYLLCLAAADADAVWLEPKAAGVTATVQADQSWLLTSSLAGEYSVESSKSLPAKHGDSFAIKVRVQVGVDMNALPELVCYDANGDEIPIPSSLLRGNRYATTNWQVFDRIFPALPNTASVRARIRARGRGAIRLDGLSLYATKI